MWLLVFWSGQGFEEEGLAKEGTFKAAGAAEVEVGGGVGHGPILPPLPPADYPSPSALLEEQLTAGPPQPSHAETPADSGP